MGGKTGQKKNTEQGDLLTSFGEQSQSWNRFSMDSET